MNVFVHSVCSVRVIGDSETVQDFLASDDDTVGQ